MNPDLSLNEQQQAFVRHREGPAALLAVPGSGKTTTMVCRTAALILAGVPADRILTMTFTKAAATDMTRRFAALYPSLADETHSTVPGFSTIHSFSLYLIRYYCRVRQRPMPVILAESGSGGPGVSGQPTRLGMLASIYQEVVGGRIGDDTLEALSMQISLHKNTMESPGTGLPGHTVKGFREVFTRYEAEKKARRLVDFDDMLTVAHRILTMDTGVLTLMRERYDYVQVDEAQDSSIIQHELIDLVARPKNNLVLIGDEDQSIYVWRGAHPSGLLGFQERYPEAKVYMMETNYRSRRDIVHLADRFIRRNVERTVKNLQVPETVTGSVKGKRSGIHLEKVKNLSAQYQRIRELAANRVYRESMAILYRNNRSVYGLADMLERAGIPFRLRDFRDTLFNHWVTRDIRAFLTLMADPTDREAFYAVAGKLNAYLSRELLQQLRSLPGEGTIWRQIRKSGLLTKFQSTRMDEVEHRFRRLARMKPADALAGLLDCVAYDKTIEFASRTGGYAPEFLNGLLDILKTVAAEEPTTTRFLARLDELRDILESARFVPSQSGTLVLSTIHSAKGLEFDRVLLVDMVEGEFPSEDMPGEGKELEEERRLCYVAITRAREELRVFVPARRAEKKVEPSRFIREMEVAMRQTSQ